MKKEVFKLCYVRSNILYFTDNFAGQDGDDWDDAPYEHNAGTPYEFIEGRNDNGHRGHLRYIACLDLDAQEPCDYYVNSPYSVDSINKGAMPWLTTSSYGNLMAGTTIEEAMRWLTKTGCKWAELK